MTPPWSAYNNGPLGTPLWLLLSLAFSKSVGLSHFWALRLLSSSHLATGPYTLHTALTPLSSVTSQILVSNNPHENIFQNSIVRWILWMQYLMMVMVIDVPIKLGISYQR